MPFSTTILFYLLIGMATAVAVFVSEHESRGRSLQAALAIFFWPILLPMLLSSPAQTETVCRDSWPANVTSAAKNDAMARSIGQVEIELDAALESLDGWSEGMLTREAERIGELKDAWSAQAERIRELDGLLNQTGFVDSTESTDASSGFQDGCDFDQRLSAAEETRQANIRRLREMRRQMHSDLMGTLAWVRELVTMIHLARFSGAPASRAAELVARIAAAVEGLSEVSTWSPTDELSSTGDRTAVSL